MKPICLLSNRWFRRLMYAKSCVPISVWMTNLVVEIQNFFSGFYVMIGALSIWWYPIVERLVIFIPATKFLRMLFMLHPRVFGPEPIWNASALTTITQNCLKQSQKV